MVTKEEALQDAKRVYQYRERFIVELKAATAKVFKTEARLPSQRTQEQLDKHVALLTLVISEEEQLKEILLLNGVDPAKLENLVRLARQEGREMAAKIRAKNTPPGVSG